MKFPHAGPRRGLLASTAAATIEVMAERRSVRLRRSIAQSSIKPKRHESGVLIADEVSGSPRLWRTVAWSLYGPPGQATRAYVETVERLREHRNERARPSKVSLIHFGEVKDETVIEPASSQKVVEARPGPRDSTFP